MNCSKCLDKPCCKVFYIRVHPEMLPIMKDPTFSAYLTAHNLSMDKGYIVKEGKCMALDMDGNCTYPTMPKVCRRDGPEFDNHADIMCPPEAYE